MYMHMYNMHMYMYMYTFTAPYGTAVLFLTSTTGMDTPQSGPSAPPDEVRARARASNAHSPRVSILPTRGCASRAQMLPRAVEAAAAALRHVAASDQIDIATLNGCSSEFVQSVQVRRSCVRASASCVAIADPWIHPLPGAGCTWQAAL